MNTKTITLLLADDDPDDCMFFQDALRELPVTSTLTTVSDGVRLMELLEKEDQELPDILFLDLNMPRKTGFECLSEIRLNQRFKGLPIVIFSTSLDMSVVKDLQKNGAQCYVRKPGEFATLKKVIHKALLSADEGDAKGQTLENFVIQP